MKCYKCNQQLKLNSALSVSRSEECPSCYVNIRCCRMCEFYDKNSYNECKEPMADRILEKEKSNFCDHYKISSRSAFVDDKKSLISAADALFKK